MTGVELVLAGTAVAAGACIQGAVGFGLGLLAAPMLALIDRELVPGPLLFVAMLLTLLVAHRERGSIDVRGVRWAIVGRLPGTALGALAVAALPERGMTLTFALLVLAAVAMSVSGRVLHPSPRTLFAAGAVSGFMGTASSIGGPPIALVYQRASGSQLRSTLAGYFVIGALISLTGLALFGEFGVHEVAASFVLVPFMLAGFGFSHLASRVLDRGYTRVAVLTLSAASSLVLIVQELWH